MKTYHKNENVLYSKRKYADVDSLIQIVREGADYIGILDEQTGNAMFVEGNVCVKQVKEGVETTECIDASLLLIAIKYYKENVGISDEFKCEQTYKYQLFGELPLINEDLDRPERMVNTSEERKIKPNPIKVIEATGPCIFLK